MTKAPGSGVVVAVIDTGVDYTHEDLASSMWVNSGEIPDNGIDDDNNGYIDDYHGIDATSNPLYDGAKAGDPMDYNGHGTHVAGIIAMADNGIGGIGVAYGAKIMAVKAGQATGTFASSDIAEAIDYAVAMGADVINMSFGGTGRSALVEEALERAFSTCVLVAAAGNSGKTTTDALPYGFLPFEVEDIYPAGYSYVLGVMSTDQSGDLASYSNWDYISGANCEYEMAAPGSGIYSTIPGNRYAEWNGTSMAAPMVAASAAVLRGYFNDKSEYNSRFIMGQLASATRSTADHMDKYQKTHTYAALNLYDSMYYLPKPNLTVNDVFLLDSKDISAVNDADAIADAGETIDLGISIRNQWGKTGAVTIKADVLSMEGGQGTANPDVEFITDTITIGAIGTYSAADNGFVYDDSLLVSVSNPIRFKIKDTASNDAEISINLTVTSSNGWDENDSTVYTANTTYTFRVQKGMEVSGHITQDTTWTKDKYWIIKNAVLIDEGATLTVEPGTQIQFWSSDYEDAYGELTMAYIQNSGNLYMNGTEEEPIEIFPGAGFEDYVCQIAGDGYEQLEYCNIINPRLGVSGMGDMKNLDKCNHCIFTQNYDYCYSRFINNGKIGTDSYYYYALGCLMNSVTACRFNYFRAPYESELFKMLFVSCSESVFNKCSIKFTSDNTYVDNNYVECNTDFSDSVFIGGSYCTDDKNNAGTSMTSFASVPTVYPSINSIVYDEDSVSKYVVIDPYAFSAERDLMRDLAEELGGSLACFSDQAEEYKVRDLLAAELEKRRGPGSPGSISDAYYIGYEFDPDSSAWKWDDGSSYDNRPDNISDSQSYPYAYFNVSSYSTNSYGNICATDSSHYKGLFYLLECPKTMSDDQIRQKLGSFNYDKWIKVNLISYLNNSAILNTVLDLSPDYWTHFTAPEYQAGTKYLLGNNYWGTENSTLINKMIIDDNDFPGTLADIDEDPILTLESDSLKNIYPFVTNIYVTEKGGSQAVSDVAPGGTYDVHVTYNRDMDQSVSPSITYGGAYPFTDNMITGSWKNAREWVGSMKVSSVTTGGNQIFRAAGGCAADDAWLVCGTDELRFQFNDSSTGAQSMVLNATGGNGKVDLSWYQNDYELLSGYNIYRSTDQEYGYSKIYSAVKGEDEYCDTDVSDGITYYYYFTIVDTDGNEIDGSASNIAAAAPRDREKPSLSHTKVTSTVVGQDITISAAASDNIAVSGVTLYYRKTGDTSYTALPLTLLNNNYVGKIPADIVTSVGVQYYIEASDTAGNKAYSGSAASPLNISADQKPLVNAIYPSTIDCGYDGNITLYGANLSSSSVVKFGSITVSGKQVNADGTEMTFKAPQLAVGLHSIQIDGNTMAKKLTCRDTASYVQIFEQEIACGQTLKLPVYVSVLGNMTALRLEAKIPYEKFGSIGFEKGDNVSVSPTYNYDYGTQTLTVSFASQGNFNPGAQSPIGYIVLSPLVVSSEAQVKIDITTAKVNNADVGALSSAVVSIFPNYSLSATVRYYASNKAVSGVAITADGITGLTDANGSAVLTGIKRSTVNIYASKAEGVEREVDANDAVLVLKYCAFNNVDASGDPILTAYQQLAADVDGDGYVTEMDASLILQRAVKLISTFDVGNWIFVESPKSQTLSSSMTYVGITAILAGDVDGSLLKGNELPHIPA